MQWEGQVWMPGVLGKAAIVAGVECMWMSESVLGCYNKIP